MKTIKTIGQAIIMALAIYGFVGTMIVANVVLTGYQGGDMLTEHYRHVLQAIVSLF